MEKISPITKRHQRFQSIDALRGIAALLVMIMHISRRFLESPKLRVSGRGLLDFFEIFDFGRIGITIFFIISGFVICKSFNRDRRELKSFAIKRFFRLYPLFWFSMLASAVAMWYMEGRSLSVGTVVANLTMLPAFFRSEFMIGLYWSLETELIFYVIAALMYFKGWLRNPMVLMGMTLLMFVLLVGFVFVPEWAPSLPHWTATPYHLSLMFFGVTCRYAFDGVSEVSGYGGLTNGSWSRVHLFMILMVPVGILLLGQVIDLSAMTTDAVAYLTGIALFIAGLKLLHKAPRVLVYLGMISYSLYLLHPIVFGLVRLGALKVPFLQGYHVSVYIILCTVLTILVSHLTYRYIEQPANQLGRQIANPKV